MNFGRTRDRDDSPTLVRRDALGIFAFILLLVLLAPALSRAQGADSLVVQWTAPGDDGNVGKAALYELRLSVVPLTVANFKSGLIVPGMPDPLTAGTHQSFVIRGLTRGTTYWLAMRTMDDVGNWSDLSNVVRFDWPPDASPPATPTAVNAGQVAGNAAVRVAWAANGEPDLAGYRVYRASAASGPFTQVASVGAAATSWTDTQLPAGVDALWYQVSAFDASGGEGARSAALQVVLQAGFPGLPTAWNLTSAYPNPAHVGADMRFVLESPGGGEAHVDVLDGAGRRVRRLEAGTPGQGVHELAWDGRNDAGQVCAPGVYRARLVAPGATKTLVVARVP